MRCEIVSVSLVIILVPIPDHYHWYHNSYVPYVVLACEAQNSRAHLEY